MLDKTQQTSFPKLNRGYNSVFKPDQLSLGLVVPIENYSLSTIPTMKRHIERAQLAEELGFKAVWLRDVPFNVPTFGDAGQTFDPFVYLGALAMATSEIALGVASVILPLRHPAHVAKAAATADVLSQGRLLLGVASGDRPEEYPALNMSFHDRGERFREAMAYIRGMAEQDPQFTNAHGAAQGQMDMLPKPTSGRLPLLITGGSQQDPNWVAQHGDGWMTYPRDAASQGRVVADYRRRSRGGGGGDDESDDIRVEKPVMQSLYIDLLDDPNAAPRPIHLGFQSGTNFLRSYLLELRTLGINHVAINLRFNQADTETTLKRLADDLLGEFNI